MKRILGLTPVLSAMLLIFLNCGGSPSVTGKWSLDSAGMKEAVLGEKTAGLSEAERKEMESNPMFKGMLDMFDKIKVNMELEADGTCSGTTTMMNKTESTSGTWKMEGDILSVTMKSTKDDNHVNETKKFKVEGDKLKVILSEEDKKAGRPAFVFIRD